MTNIAARNEAPGRSGIILHSSAAYDLLLWILTLGRERAFREKMLRPAQLRPGESVLDIGCGTGTLAIAAKRQVGPAGTVHGLDASPEMLARAKNKARRAGVEVAFENAFAQSLPFPDARFDVVLTTVMLHHLPKEARRRLAAEVRRVLKPGGRVLAIDFAGGRDSTRFLDRLHRRHGYVEPREMLALFSDAGLSVTASGDVGLRGLHFVAASAPCAA